MEVSLNETFAKLFIQINDHPVQINALGVLKSEDKEFIVLTDMEGLISADEYVIYELLREPEFSLTWVQEDLYDQLCDIWESHVEQLEV